ncbi:MAG TPA: hypothetical protein VFZ33_11345 [Chitinophagaceae bacterium]
MQILKFILLYGAIIIVFSCFVKRTGHNCDTYRTGKFYIFNKVNKQRIDIERRDSLQIETNEDGDITVLKVKWTSACDYELLFNYMTPKEVSIDKNVQRIFDSNGDVPLRIKILGGTDSYYVFEAGKQGLKNLRDTVWLVK